MSFTDYDVSRNGDIIADPDVFADGCRPVIDQQTLADLFRSNADLRIARKMEHASADTVLQTGIIGLLRAASAVEDAPEYRYSLHQVNKTGFRVGSDLVIHAFGKISCHILDDGVTGDVVE